jgi:hypothetical protein
VSELRNGLPSLSLSLLFLHQHLVR